MEVEKGLFSWRRLIQESLTGMHGYRTFSRRDGKAAFEGHGRSGQSRVHGQSSGRPFLSKAADIVGRNTTFEIQHPLKKASDIRMSFTTLLDGITLLSTAHSNNGMTRTDVS